VTTKVRRILLVLVGLCAIAAPATAAPTLMRGTPVPGEAFATQLIVLGTSTYELCSAAVWKPRVLLTAAHCLTDTGSSVAATSNRIFVMPPGVGSVAVYASGPVGAAPVRVTGAYLGQQYAETSKVVVGNDIAAITLDADLAQSSFTRLADRTEIAAWARSQHETTIIGYGITSPSDTTPSLPRTAGFQLAEVQTDRRGTNGWTTWSNPINGVDTCPGDSGAPQFVSTPTSTLLLGDIAGGNCTGQPRTAEAFAAMTYLEVLNPALTAAGYPTIPSAPQEIIATRIGDTETVWWAMPRISPETVTSFEVRDASGTTLCTSTQPYCTFAAKSDLTIRSMNSQGEGDAETVPEASPVRPEPPSVQRVNGLVRFTISALRYPVVSGYRVIDQSGKVACRITKPAVSMNCAAKLKRGNYRFTVSASTPQGRTTESLPTHGILID